MIPIEIVKAVLVATPAANPIFITTPTAAKERKEMKPRMMKRNSQFQSSLAGACGVLLVLLAAQPGVAQQGASLQPAATVAAASTATTSSAKLPAIKPPVAQSVSQEKEDVSAAKPGSEGIKVHGHWVIDVRNPDGSLVEHRDFENSLQDKGEYLTELVSGYATFGGYVIGLSGNACPGALASGDTSCYFIQNATLPTEGCGPVLTCIGALSVGVNLKGVGTPAFSIMLSGSGAVPLAGTITAVQTQAFPCYAAPSGSSVPPTSITSASPSGCVTGSFNENFDGFANVFTGTTLTNAGGAPAPLAVTAGQLVQVTVTISFS